MCPMHGTVRGDRRLEEKISSADVIRRLSRPRQGQRYGNRAGELTPAAGARRLDLSLLSEVKGQRRYEIKLLNRLRP